MTLRRTVILAALVVSACKASPDKRIDTVIQAFIPNVSIQDSIGALRAKIGPLVYSEAGAGFLRGPVAGAHGFDSVYVYDLNRSLLEGWDPPPPGPETHFGRLTLLSSDTANVGSVAVQLRSLLGPPSRVVCSAGGVRRLEIWQMSRNSGVALAWRGALGARQPSLTVMANGLKDEVSGLLAYSPPGACT